MYKLVLLKYIEKKFISDQLNATSHAKSLYS